MAAPYTNVSSCIAPDADASSALQPIFHAACTDTDRTSGHEHGSGCFPGGPEPHFSIRNINSPDVIIQVTWPPHPRALSLTHGGDHVGGVQVNRYELMNSTSGEKEVKVLTKDQQADAQHFKDKETGAELEVQETVALLEWLASSYKKFGCALEFVTNKSQEGSQFCRGFGGIGGLLRYAVDPTQFEPDDDGLDAKSWNSSDSDI